MVKQIGTWPGDLLTSNVTLKQGPSVALLLVVYKNPGKVVAHSSEMTAILAT